MRIYPSPLLGLRKQLEVCVPQFTTFPDVLRSQCPSPWGDLVTGASSCLGSSKPLGETFLPSFSVVFGEKEVLLEDPPPQASASWACGHIHGFDS